jgi:hypothetical protein
MIRGTLLFLKNLKRYLIDSKLVSDLFFLKSKNHEQIGPHVLKIVLFIDLQLLSHRFKKNHVHQLVVSIMFAIHVVQPITH